MFFRGRYICLWYNVSLNDRWEKYCHKIITRNCKYSLNLYNKQPWTQQFNIIDMKHEDIVINQENPFANCKLGREPYANILSSIVDSYAKGFVLAINGEWGVGKTTFVKMWRRS